jgi:hypothetical protein
MSIPVKILNSTIHMILLILLSSIAFFSSCTTPPQNHHAPKVHLAADEKEWMFKFFHDLLFEEGICYTLWGSKPMTRVVLYHYTDEEIQNYYDSLPESEKQYCRISLDYDLPENWERWKKVSDRFPLNRYLFFEQTFEEDPTITFLYFVDILRTALLIQDNYSDFSKAVGFDFDPLEVVLEMPDSSSPFWTKMNALTWGLLFGYGKENASSFQWKHFSDGSKSSSFFSCIDCERSEKFAAKKSQDTFDLPAFISFFENDPVVEKYKNERSTIQKIYKKEDLLEATLARLTRK